MKVVICGAGIAGLALARLLGRAGRQVVLIERAAALRDQGYLIDFFGPGFDAAEAMGLLPRLHELAYPVTEVSYVDRQGYQTTALDYRRLTATLGGRLLVLMRGDLAHVLHEGLGDEVELVFGQTVATVQQSPDELVVRLSGGAEHRADLLVGSDGIHSQVRRLVFGPDQDYLRYLGFHTGAYTFADAELHRKLGSRFLLTDSVNHQVGLYALRDGQVAVTATHRSSDPELPADPRVTLSRTHFDLGWLIPDVLEYCPDPPELYYDQVAQIEMATWHRGRVVLLGDACQAVSLLAGQGASLAVAAAHVLAGELARGGKIPDALARYQARLLPAVRDRQVAGRRAAEWFLPSSQARLLLRRLALQAMRLPVLDRLFTAGPSTWNAGSPSW